MKTAHRKVIDTLVVAVLTDKNGKTRTFQTRNIVTDAGDLYYAERGAAVAVPTNFVDGGGAFDGVMELYDNSPANSAPAKGNDRSNLTGTLAPSSTKAMDATYPLVNDPDGDNTGAGTDVVTYRVSYTTGEANAADITDVIITNPTPGASEPLLMHAEFGAAFTKTSSDTLKVFVNHQLNGV